MSNRELKLTTNLGNKTKKRQLSEKRSRRARGLRALNLPTTVTGSLETAENGSLSDAGHNALPIALACTKKCRRVVSSLVEKSFFIRGDDFSMRK
jgi:hypothetical protein